MTLCIQDSRFLFHKPGAHPESPERLLAITEALNKTPVANVRFENAKPALEIDILKTHHHDVYTLARNLSHQGGGRIDGDTFLSAESFATALLAAGSAKYAVEQVLEGHHPNALVLGRPPGHHATKNQSMGFCLFNNAAIAANHGLSKGAQRILIVDWDVHHGNGTQDIFYERDDVIFFSIHRFPFYPGTGAADEIGQGNGRGATINVPLTFGVTKEQYLASFTMGLEKSLKVAKPDLVIISAGFDAHKDDPVGNLGLDAQDYGTLTKIVTQSGCKKIVSLLEGGYNPKALGESVREHLKALSEV